MVSFEQLVKMRSLDRFRLRFSDTPLPLVLYETNLACVCPLFRFRIHVLCTLVHGSTVYTSQDVRHPKCPLTKACIKMWYITQLDITQP